VIARRLFAEAVLPRLISVVTPPDKKIIIELAKYIKICIISLWL
jgi:hypothetical protein